jgi:hypothetical protein
VAEIFSMVLAMKSGIFPRTYLQNIVIIHSYKQTGAAVLLSNPFFHNVNFNNSQPNIPFPFHGQGIYIHSYTYILNLYFLCDTPYSRLAFISITNVFCDRCWVSSTWAVPVVAGFSSHVVGPLRERHSNLFVVVWEIDFSFLFLGRV